MKIYLIDDDAVSNFLFESVLDKVASAIEVRAFLSGKEVLEVLDRGGTDQYPDIIFVDLSMPILDGWELLHELGQRHSELVKKCKIYILTSSIREEDQVRGEAHSMVSGFLQKPLKQDDVLSILSNYLHGTEK